MKQIKDEYNGAYVDALMPMMITAVGLGALIGPLWILKTKLAIALACRLYLACWAGPTFSLA